MNKEKKPLFLAVFFVYSHRKKTEKRCFYDKNHFLVRKKYGSLRKYFLLYECYLFVNFS